MKKNTVSDLLNFRDLGGLSLNDNTIVAPKKIYRTGNIAHLKNETAETLHDVLKIKTYIDFREPDEIKRFGEPQALRRVGIEWINLPIETNDPAFIAQKKPQVTDWIDFYLRLFEKNEKRWAEFFKIIDQASDPLVYGCLFGKDRTGIASALLLHHLGVPDDIIAHDYSLTTEGLKPNVYHLKDVWSDTSLTEDEVQEHYLKARPEIILGFLSQMSRSSHPTTQRFKNNLKLVELNLKNKLLTKKTSE